jgi:hypothetical protein
MKKKEVNAMRDSIQARRSRADSGEKPSVTVSAFGAGSLDNPDATLSVEECEAMSKAWSRAALAIRLREYGEVKATDEDGDEMLCVTLDYDSIAYDDKSGYPLIATFATLKARRAA